MTQLMTIDELHRILVDCAGSDDAGASAGDVADIPFDRLGYDSLALIETEAKLKVDHGVVIPYEQIIEVGTLGELLRLVNETIAV